MPLAVLLFLVFCACTDSTEPSMLSPCGPTTAHVERVIDGDTIELTTGERVRYLLVDTNEITNGHNDCYGPEARLLNESLVGGMDVHLAYDQECTDRYGRLLAYVTVGTREVNTILVERGYACTLYIPPDGSARRKEFQALESQAKNAKRGMWGACAEVACAK